MTPPAARQAAGKARRPLHAEFALFVGAGALAALAHYSALLALVEWCRVNPTLASTLGFATGALVSYLFNYRVTFRSDKYHREALHKFLLVALVGAGLNATAMQAAITHAHLHYLSAQVVATGLVLFWSYSANRWWTFR